MYYPSLVGSVGVVCIIVPWAVRLMVASCVWAVRLIVASCVGAGDTRTYRLIEHTRLPALPNHYVKYLSMKVGMIK